MSVDWAASFAADVAVDPNGNAKPTAPRFAAGMQSRLEMVLDLGAPADPCSI